MAIRLGNHGSSRIYSPITQKVYHSKLNYQHMRLCNYFITAWEFTNWAKAPCDTHMQIARTFQQWKIHLLSIGCRNI